MGRGSPGLPSREGAQHGCLMGELVHRYGNEVAKLELHNCPHAP
jgi:hypothetical protein